MELMERTACMAVLEKQYQQAEKGTGHALFLSGEAGVGKTSVINELLKKLQRSAKVYVGACDSLFTPRPLGPLYDIAGQIGGHFIDLLKNEKDRALIFASLLRELSSHESPVILIFEDIHWADEATLDLIKFLARRISRFRCLFLLTYRDDDINLQHPLNTIFGELPDSNFSRMEINRLSREAVEKLALARGYSTGEEVYALTGGNPFYVKEILASYSPGIPKRVKDSVLTVFFAMGEKTQALWEFLSIFPSGIEFSLIDRMDSTFHIGIEKCMQSGVIVTGEDHFSFKHELFRLAIEESLSAFKRKRLHKKVLNVMLESPLHSNNLARLVHHAKHADEKNIVSEFAPKAAIQAATIGSHIEAAKLYRTAIEYSGKNDPNLVTLYEQHAFECYLTNQIGAAIDSQERALLIWRDRNDSLKEGDALRFLSRLWWFAGEQQKAKLLAHKSIEILDKGSPTRERALAYSNLSQIFMLAEDSAPGLFWGKRAIDLAILLEDQEIHAHALTNIGIILLKSPCTESEGEENLKESLSISLANEFHDDAARAYANLLAAFVLIRKYQKAKDVFERGIKYCESRDLSAWSNCILQWKVRMLLETGDWNETEYLAERLQGKIYHVVKPIAMSCIARIRTRRGDFEAARSLINQAKTLALPTGEAQRIVPVLVAELELQWHIGESCSNSDLDYVIKKLFPNKNNSWYYSELAFWMNKNGVLKPSQETVEYIGPYRFEMKGAWMEAARSWKDLGCPYEEALSLSDGNEKYSKAALSILEKLGATATHHKVRSKLKSRGIRNIPRGPHSKTRSNSAHLTSRQIEVLTLLHEGLQNNEIAEKLFISTKTVDNHISAIFWKLDVNSRARAVLEAKKLGILQ